MDYNMKKILILLATIITAICSCNKEEPISSNVDNNDNGIETVKAIAEDGFVTKSDYSIEGTTAIFTWENGDKFYQESADIQKRSLGKKLLYVPESK